MPENQCNEVDPPLTVTGIEQARKTGRFVKKYFEQTNMQFGQIVVKTSPFLRTVMTASHIAAELGTNKVVVDSMVSEFMSNKMFE